MSESGCKCGYITECVVWCGPSCGCAKWQNQTPTPDEIDQLEAIVDADEQAPDVYRAAYATIAKLRALFFGASDTSAASQ